MSQLLKRGSLLPLLFSSFLIINSSVSGQSGISVDHVDGEAVPGVLGTSTPIKFYIRMNNTTGLKVMAAANGFSITSTNGANWDTTTGAWTGTVTTGMWNIQDINDFSHSTDGLAGDTIGFGGAATPPASGVPIGFNQIIWTISIGPLAKSNHGKTICIDSSYYSGAEWRWALTGGGGVDPDWSGPHCYSVDSTYDDVDGDGDLPPNDNCPTIANPGQEDADFDLVGNVCDNCVNVANAGQGDADGDGIGDACDLCTDTDNDGFGNPGFPVNTCALDNCPTIYNLIQGDLDLDGIGDVCDPQTDLTFDEEPGEPAEVFAMRTGDINNDNLIDIDFCGGAGAPGLNISFAIDETSFAPSIECYNLYNAALSIDFVNSDLLPDLIAATLDTIFILINDGSNDCSNWNVIKIPNPSAVEPTIPAVSTGYFDDDNALDIFVAPDAMLYGDGTGHISETATIPIVASSIVKGDFDNDGFEDLLAVKNDSAVLLLNDGLGNYSYATAVFIDTGYLTVPVDNAATDLDSDCNLDFVVVTPDADLSGQSILTLGFGDGLGAFDQYSTLNINGVVQDILVIDIDRDNIQDILASNATMQRVEIYRGNGDRTFDAPELFSTASAGGDAFSLASADFDRDGQPDFLSAGSDNGNVLLTSSNLANVPVLPDEMVLTGLTNVTMQITNPLGYQASEQVQTIAGADVWRVDANGDSKLDEQIIDYNLLDGDYTMTFFLRPEFDSGASVTQPLTSAVRINGSQQVSLLDNYSIAGSARVGKRMAGCATDSVVIKFHPDYINPAFIKPSYGLQTNTRRPEYNWNNIFAGHIPALVKYHIQFDTLVDFSNPFYEDSTLAQPKLCGPSLGSGSSYYWRVRGFDGVSWTEFSNPLVAKIGGGCCDDDIRGDVNDDDNDANILDLTFLVDRIFRGGPAPTCFEESDVNSDCNAHDILDLVFLVDRIFRGGPAPGPCPIPLAR